MLLDLLVPPRCLSCGAPAADLCGTCRRALVGLRDACPRCALEGHRRGCPARDAPWDRALASVVFAGAARDVVHASKLRRSRAAIALMAARLAADLRSSGLGEDRSVVPVPPHPRRARRQGWDHSGLLATDLARRLGTDVGRPLRRRGEARQVDAGSAAERRRAAAAGFEAAGRVPPRVLLVDDVHTTGATLRSCAAALLDAGAGTVVVATFARTPEGRSSTS